MSTLSALPKPLKLVLKPGTYQSGDTRGGLNINNWMKNFLKRIGFAVVGADCCTYYPTFPLIILENDGAPTDVEMDAYNIPSFGLFVAKDDINVNDYTIYMRMPGSNSVIELGST